MIPRHQANDTEEVQVEITPVRPNRSRCMFFAPKAISAAEHRQTLVRQEQPIPGQGYTVKVKLRDGLAHCARTAALVVRGPVR
jgi:hypothetical protein